MSSSPSPWRLKGVLGRAFIFFALCSPALATEPQTVVHKKQNSSVDLTSGDRVTAHVYRLTRSLTPKPGTGTYDGKPLCKEDRIRSKPVYFPTKELQDFDMKIYDYKDKEQVKQAKQSSTPTVPYIEGDRYNPKRDRLNLQQSYARFFDIRCLPTRIHYVKRGGRLIEEYREGARAWD